MGSRARSGTTLRAFADRVRRAYGGFRRLGAPAIVGPPLVVLGAQLARWLSPNVLRSSVLGVLVSWLQLTFVAMLVRFAMTARWRRTHPFVWQGSLFVLLAGVCARLVQDDLVNFIGRHRLPATVVDVSAGVAAVGALRFVFWLGEWFGRLRGAALISGVAPFGAGVCAVRLFPGDYLGLHLVLAALALAFAEGAQPLDDDEFVDQASDRHVLGLGAALLGAFAVGVTPVMTTPDQIVLPFVRRLLAPGLPTVVRTSQVWTDRPPTGAFRVPPGGLAVLVTIDALRADIVDKHAAAAPSIGRLARESVVFQRAYTPAAHTRFAFACIFSGKPYSGLYWTAHPIGHIYPWQDETPRFPELLRAAGVKTHLFAGLNFMAGEYGVTRGFADEHVPTNRDPFFDLYTDTDTPTTTALIESLRQTRRDERHFFHVHLVAPHSPYTLGGKEGTSFERYLREVTIADSQVGRIRQALEEMDLWDRTVFVVSADHGEAFGEHGVTDHGLHVWDEVIRVPLIVHVPQTKAHADDGLVSSIDLGPTFLDAFGVSTPGWSLGISLLPRVIGNGAARAAPVVSEARALRAMIWPDGHKVIWNTQTGEAHLFDLRSDPAEQYPLDGTEPALLARSRAEVVTFFAEHTLDRPGYRVPFQSW